MPLKCVGWQRIIEDDLKGDLSTFFSFVDEKPLASASIAQVKKREEQEQQRSQGARAGLFGWERG